MTIKSECFNICKSIWKLNFRDQVKELIESFSNPKPQENINPLNDRILLGYYANRIVPCSQFLSYLLVNRDRDILKEKGIFDIIKLNDNELNLLKKAHFILNYLNEQCLTDLISHYPDLNLLLNPYSRFNYNNDKFDINDMLNPQSLTSLISAFKISVPVKNILNSGIKISLEQSLEAIGRIESCGVHSAPEGFTNLSSIIPEDPHEIFKKHLFSIISIRKMLQNINQLMYQAFLSKKLALLGDENIVTITQRTHHTIGEGLTILIQPTGDEFGSKPGDVILVKHSYTDIDYLCSIEDIGMSFNQEYGLKNQFALRVLDENLNPFFGLLS